MTNRKIFLDVGAWQGNSVSFFREYFLEASEFEIFCFDPLPENIEALKLISDIHIIEAAAWSSNGEENLYLGASQGVSMYADKKTGYVDPENKIIVHTIDFAEFIILNFNKEDEIWLKLNVEGAEYEIIPHLYKNNLIDWFDRIYVKWHSEKIPSLQVVDKEVRAMVPYVITNWREIS
jgi:FkbM family methyltransferase